MIAAFLIGSLRSLLSISTPIQITSLLERQKYADLLFKQHFLLLSMLKTVAA